MSPGSFTTFGMDAITMVGMMPPAKALQRITGMNAWTVVAWNTSHAYTVPPMQLMTISFLFDLILSETIPLRGFTTHPTIAMTEMMVDMTGSVRSVS